MARGAAKIVSINGALTVTFVAASGATPTVFSDEACTATTALPATVADGSATTFYFASPGSYTLSVKTASGIQIAGDLNTTKVVTVAAGDVGVYAYDTRLVSRDASGDSGRHSPGTDLAATYLQVREAPPTPLSAAYNADNTGATDASTALQGFLNAGYSTGFIPAGTYSLSTGLTLPPSMSLRLDPAAILKATSSMSAVLTTPLNSLSTDQQIHGGMIDCNLLANDGLALGYFQHFVLTGMEVRNFLRYGYKVGDATTTGSSYELLATNLRAYRGVGTIPVGSASMYLDANSTDHQISQFIGMGGETGVITGAGGCYLIACHVWTRQSQGNMVTGFDENGGSSNTYVGCYADTPTTYGFRFRGSSSASLIFPRVYNNPAYGLDNVATAFFADTTATIQCFGAQILGGDGTHRIAFDFRSGGSLSKFTSFSTTRNNIVSATTDNVGNATRFNGNLLFFNDASQDFGIAAGGRPRSIYLSGGIASSAVTKTVNYALTADDHLVFTNGTTLTMTLPAANTSMGANASKRYTIRNIHASSPCTVGSASGNVDGAATASLAAGAKATYASDGTNWYSVS